MADYSSQSYSFLNEEKVTEGFETLLGYITPSTACSVLQNILLHANISIAKLTTKQSYDAAEIYVDNSSQAKQALKYIKSKANKNGIKPFYHNAYKLTENQAQQIDNFCRYATLYLKLEHYNHPRLGFCNGRSSPGSFSKYPFQHLLTFILFVHMFSRYQLKEYLEIILPRVARPLGTQYFLQRELGPIFDVLSGKISGFGIQRRLGKSTAVFSEISRLLAFFPGAKLKILYTATRSALTNECYKNIYDCIPDYITAFNEQQRLLQDTFNTSCWFESYTYHARPFTDKKQKKILIKFDKIMNHNIIKDAEVNELTCQAFIKLNVSIFQYFAQHLLKTVICSL